MKKLDPEGEFMSCFGSTDPVTGKHKEMLIRSTYGYNYSRIHASSDPFWFELRGMS